MASGFSNLLSFLKSETVLILPKKQIELCRGFTAHMPSMIDSLVVIEHKRISACKNFIVHHKRIKISFLLRQTPPVGLSSIVAELVAARSMSRLFDVTPT